MLTLYHGSSHIIEKPEYGKGNLRNDYGQGFYCTREAELAKEWACSEENDGFANEYLLDTEGLSVLRLNDSTFHILNWLAVLLENRTFDLSTPTSLLAKNYILDNFLPNYKNYDIITGYRADDSYFSFSKAFLSNSITLEQLKRAMKLGALGEQYVIKSPKAFQKLSFKNAFIAEGTIYHAYRQARDRNARGAFVKMLSEPLQGEMIFLSDIIKEKWTNDDPRL